MDLLGGYGSGGSSDEENDNDDDHQQYEGSPIKAALPIPSSKPATSNTGPATASKKQRKLLSLGAVLPTEIFDRLVMLRQQDDEDENEDDEKDAMDSNKCEANVRSHKVKKSVGMQSLIDGLNAKLPSSSAGGTGAAEELKKEEQDEEKALPLGVELTRVSYSISSSSIKDKGKLVKNDHPLPVSKSQPQQQGYGGIDRKSNICIRPMQASLGRISAAPLVSNPNVDNRNAIDLNKSTYVQHETSSQPVKAMSKKQMERALRQGNLQSVLQDSSMAQYQQRVSSFQPSQADFEAGDQDPRDRIRHVSVGMYNPKVGDAVFSKQVTGRHKSKHQIHQLVHAAAALETEIAQKRTKTSNSRMDAKRKYGW